MKKILAFTLLAAVTVAGGIAFATLSLAQDSVRPTIIETLTTDPPAQSREITIWRDPNCGCCDAYADYLEAKGYRVTRIDDRDFEDRSIAVGVPEQGLGCHLAEIDGYYVSGLVPMEIIERLVTERSEVAGIMLPGMPPNAPGMAPAKFGTLKIYAFGEGGITVYSDE